MTCGLCETCRYLKKITNRRGSIFYLCLLSKTNNTFAKYPRIPVLECRGYESKKDGSVLE